MGKENFVKLIIPYFNEQPIELFIRDILIPTDLDMIRFKALNCLAAEKQRDEIIKDLKRYFLLVGIKEFDVENVESTSEIVEYNVANL